MNNTTVSFQYRVQKIVNTIVKGTEVFYLVKWHGYKELTEEPETNVDIRSLVEELWAKQVAEVMGEDMNQGSEEAEATFQNKHMRNLKKRSDRGTKIGKTMRDKDDSADEEFDPNEIDEGYFDDEQSEHFPLPPGHRFR